MSKLLPIEMQEHGAELFSALAGRSWKTSLDREKNPRPTKFKIIEREIGKSSSERNAECRARKGERLARHKVKTSLEEFAKCRPMIFPNVARQNAGASDRGTLGRRARQACSEHGWKNWSSLSADQKIFLDSCKML